MSRSSDPDLDFFLFIPDPGVKKAPGPRSGYATLLKGYCGLHLGFSNASFNMELTGRVLDELSKLGWSHVRHVSKDLQQVQLYSYEIVLVLHCFPYLYW
jgi:hypothetical protein